MVELNKKYGVNEKNKIIFGSSYGSKLNQKMFFEKQLKYNDTTGIPHFLIDKNGVISQILNQNYNSKFTGTKEDENAITIILEHTGYLKLNVVDNQYYDIFDTIYNKNNFSNIIWRDKCYWVKYDKKQINSLKNLCKTLCLDNNIKPSIPESNVKSKDNLSNTILGRSNISNFYLDPNPTFDFKILKELENEL